MRPLIEMLDDERMLMQKQESLYRFMERDSGVDTMDILVPRAKKVGEDLNDVHDEIRDYFRSVIDIRG